MIESQGYYRLWQIIGCKKRGVRAILPISRSAWWEGIKKNRFPRPIKLGERTTAWKMEDINDLIKKFNGGEYVKKERSFPS